MLNNMLIGPERPRCHGDPGDRHRATSMRRIQHDDGDYYWKCFRCGKMLDTIEVGNIPRDQRRRGRSKR